MRGQFAVNHIFPYEKFYSVDPKYVFGTKKWVFLVIETSLFIYGSRGGSSPEPEGESDWETGQNHHGCVLLRHVDDG